MGDPLGSFPKERVSEDKARCKDPCWFVGTVVDLEGPLHGGSTLSCVPGLNLDGLPDGGLRTLRNFFFPLIGSVEATYGMGAVAASALFPIKKDKRIGGGTNRSDIGLNLSGSWQQGHSATYNTPSRT